MERAKEYWDYSTQWFRGKSKESKPVQPDIRRISDLPLYPESQRYRFVEDTPGRLQLAVQDVRENLQEGYRDVAERYGTVGGAVKQTGEAIRSVSKFLQSEGTIYVPKAVAITAGGMAGFIYGSRRGGFVRQVFYSGVGLGTMAAFCYPHETVKVGKSAVASSRKMFEDFQASPPPPKDLVVSSSLPKSVVDSSPLTAEEPDRADVDLYTTRSSK